MKIDSIDLKILVELQRDGRLASTSLGKRIGLTAPACQHRVRQLEQAGAIAQYTAIIHAETLCPCLRASCRIRLEHPTPEDREAFETAVIGLQEVQTCHLMAGKHDYLLTLLVRDAAALSEVLDAFIMRMPGVGTVETDIVLETIKADPNVPVTLLLEDPDGPVT